ncbi:MAG: histidine phosphatase family protein [Daejeonella sp.]
MKKLLLIRHAKSDWNTPGQKDFDRSLNHRGEKNAPEMAKRAVKKGIIPQQIVSSTAKRAITTAGFFAEAFNIKKSEIRREASIYEANTTALLKVINNLDDKFEFIAVFGHNPGFTDLANVLSDADIYNIPTCGMVLIQFPFDSWKMVSAGTGEKLLFDYPKNEED